MPYPKIHLFRIGTGQAMTYYGDVYDTPPAIIRVAMTAACVFGAVVVLWFLIRAALVIPIIIAVAGVILAVYLIWSVPRASQTAIVTVLYWAILGGFALFLPLGL